MRCTARTHIDAGGCIDLKGVHKPGMYLSCFVAPQARTALLQALACHANLVKRAQDVSPPPGYRFEAHSTSTVLGARDDKIQALGKAVVCGETAPETLRFLLAQV